MPAPRPDPIYIEPEIAPEDPKQRSAFIFMHGLADDGEAFRDLANQFRKSKKLPYMTWVLPTADEDRDAMARAWYMPTGLAAIPASRPELEEDEDEDGFVRSGVYILKIVDDLVSKGIPLDRIALGGFSQGCAMTLFLGLTSKYAGQFAGLCGLMGYLPLKDRIESLKQEHAPDADITKQPVLICRGTRDILLPSRFYKACLEKLTALGVKNVDSYEHEVGHSISGAVIQDMCNFLEKILP